MRLRSSIQGHSVKRQATTTLKCMQTLARVQSEIRARRIRMTEENMTLQRQLQQKHEKELEKLRASVSGILGLIYFCFESAIRRFTFTFHDNSSTLHAYFHLVFFLMISQFP